MRAQLSTLDLDSVRSALQELTTIVRTKLGKV
jgi:hypothetical protein